MSVDGMPLIGANVRFVKQITKGVETNAFGQFAIDANIGDELLFTHVEAPDDSQTVKVVDSKPIEVYLITGTELVGVDIPNNYVKKQGDNTWLYIAGFAILIAAIAIARKDKTKTVKV